MITAGVLWAAGAAAEVLTRLGFEAEAIGAAVLVLVADNGVPASDGLGIGMPAPGDPGTHAVTLVREDGDRCSILETCAWQFARPRFAAVADMLLTSAVGPHDHPFGDMIPMEFGNYVRGALYRMPTVTPGGRETWIAWWLLTGAEPHWLGIGDAAPERATAVAD